MEFEVAKVEAEKWAEQNEWSVVVDAEGKLVFSKANCLIFYIECSQNEEDKLRVWSDDTKVLDKMTTIQNYIHSSDKTKRTLTEILTFINKEIVVSKDQEDDESEFDSDEDDDSDEVNIGLDNYYDEEDQGAMATESNSVTSNGDDLENQRFFTGKAEKATIHRLLKDLKTLQSSEGKFCVEGAPRGDDLLTWDVKLLDFPEDKPLGKDIKSWAKKYKREPVVYMEMEFPPDYPMAPPFVRVIRPRFKFLTGHVTIGGSVCMQLLTKSGWTPANDIEQILINIRSEIFNDPNARLDSNNPDRAYEKQEALNAFQRMIQKYGWH